MSDYEAAQRRRDAIVGIFVILGLASLAWMVFKFGDLPTAITSMRSFQVYARFPSAPGVQTGTAVQFLGYQVGSVTNVKPPAILEDLSTRQECYQIECVLSINRQYSQIPSNANIRVLTRGLGSSYIDLTVDPDKPPTPGFLGQGMIVQGTTGTANDFLPEELQKRLTTLAADLGTLVGNANDIIGDPNNKENVKASLANFAQAMGKASQTLEDARTTIEQFRRLAVTGNEAIKSVDADAERLINSLVNTSGEMGQAMAQLRLAMEKVNAGKGTAGRLINDGRLYESLLETTNQLNLTIKDLNDLIDKVSEKGLRSVY